MFSEIKNIFVLTFILGGFLIVYGNYSGYYIITIILSILIMLIYFFTTLYLNTTKRQISMEQLADSNYYLGFMFTLISILISLIGTVSNSYDIDNIINNFAVSMITTLIGLLARVYLANFIPTNESNKEIINQSISDKMRIINEILLDNMQKNKVFSQMIDVRMTILVESTQEALKQFKKLLDEDFKSTIKTFNDSIKNITVNMDNTHKKQTKILFTEYEKVKKKSEEYEEVIDNQKKAIIEFGAQIKKNLK
jgi:hypothetical protein